jgi:hypothetical protein
VDASEIIHQLEHDPSLRAQLRAVLLGDQFLDLPQQLAALTARVNALAEAQARTEATLRELIASTNARLDRIETDISGLKTDVAGLKTDVAGLKTDVAGLKTDVAGLKTDVAELKGDSLGRRVTDNPARYIWQHAERVSVVTPPALDDLAHTLGQVEALSPAEMQRLRNTDLVAQARRPGSSERITVVAEVSHTLHADDVLRAAASARIFSVRSLRSLAMAIGVDLGGTDVASLASKHEVVLVSAART